jgi:2,2-dialkylglycine decarboxylase (pyruvate)
MADKPRMTKADVKAIADRWMIPVPGVAYMAGIENRPVVERALGATFIDTEGKEYLDFGSGQMGAALGHNHPKIVEAIRESLETILHSTKTFLNTKRLELHEKLGRILTKPLQRSLFLVSGSDSVEAAVDLARKATGGLDILGFHTGLHGSTSFVTRSLSFGWNRKKHALNAPATTAILAPYCYRCPVGRTFPGCGFQCLKTSMEFADANFTAKPAATIVEPIMSAGGMIVPPPGYMAALRQACDERGMLLIFDESQTCLGKTGKLWGHQHDGVVPDIMTISKHFGGGLPISAVCTTDEIAKKAVANGYFATRSHATDPVLCNAGSASIDVVLEEDMPARAAHIEQRMKAGFEALAREFPLIGDIRGRGVMLGVELVTDRVTKEPANAEALAIVDYCQDAGLAIQSRGSHGRNNILRFIPPMTTSDSQIDRALSILRAAFVEVTQMRMAPPAAAQ